MYVVLTLMLAELLLRIPAISSALPQPNPYYDPGVETRLRALEAVLATHGSVDFLFVGSSIVRTNVQPLVFDREVAGRTGAGVVSFNGGLSALPPDPAHLYLEHFWLKHVSPRVVVQSIRYDELQFNMTVQEWGKLVSAKPLEHSWMDSSIWSRMRAAAMENVRLFYYSGTFKESLRFFRWPLNSQRGLPVDIRGYGATSLTLAEVRDLGQFDENEAYEGDVINSKFVAGIETLKSTIDLCRQRGIEYVLVNMPVYGSKFLNATDGDERYRAYIAQLKRLSQEKNVPFVDLTESDPRTYNKDVLWSDHHHMSQLGAEKFSMSLGRYFAEHLEHLVRKQ